MSAELAPPNTQTPVTPALVDTSKAYEKAIADVKSLVESITKSATGASEETLEAVADAAVEKVKTGAGAVRKNYRQTLKAAKIEGESYVNAMKAFDALNAPVADTTKAAQTEENAALAAIGQLSETITKAKNFTSASRAELVAKLEALKAVIDDLIRVPQATMPATTTPALLVSPGAMMVPSDSMTGVTKSIVDLAALVAKAVTDSNTALADTTKRLEAIEKARMPGNAGGSEITETPTTKKTSMWKSVI